MIAQNNCGTDTTTQEVVISMEIPVAAFAADTTNGCLPLIVNFNDQSSGNPTNWSWSFPGGTPATSTNPNPTVTYPQAGTYDVTLEVGNLAGSNTLIQNQVIQVLAPPEAGFTFQVQGDTAIFTNTSTGAGLLTWSFGDGTTSNQSDPSHIFMEPGTYSVTLTVANPCGTSTYSEEVIVEPNAVGDLSWLQECVLFPNPNDGKFQVRLSGSPVYGQPLQVRMYSVLGQQLLMEEHPFDTGIFTASYELDYLPKGIYVFQLSLGQVALLRKVVIE
jgi:PKD repeat protein